MNVNDQLEARTRIALELDIDGLIALMRAEGCGTPTREAAEITLHKVRCSPVFPAPEKLRQESRQWLEDRGYTPEVVGWWT